MFLVSEHSFCSKTYYKQKEHAVSFVERHNKSINSINIEQNRINSEGFWHF